MPGPIPLVIDTDAGIDDVVALALAARTPALELVGVTVTYGNTDLCRATRNARHVLGLAGLPHVPVLAGADRPLRRPPPPAIGRHGPEGTGAAPVGAAPTVSPRPAALFELLRGSPRPVTLVTLGPLTNLAHALARDGTLVRQRVTRLVAAFGNFGEAVSAERHADFNAWCDPEAADHVLRAGLPLELVPLDVSGRFGLAGAELADRLDANAPLARWLGAAVRWRMDAEGGAAATLPDVVPVAAAIDARVLTLAQRRVGIDFDNGALRGRTVAGAGTEAAVAVDVGLRRVHALLHEGLWRPRGTAGTDKETR